jgi:AraC-like DNA-binding protein
MKEKCRKSRKFAVEMREMQFTAVVLMTLLTLKLLLLPVKVTANKVIRRSWLLMISATTIVGLQFLLQYVFRLRQIGVTQAVMLNLALLIPATVLFSLAIFSLQRRLRQRDIYIGLFTWLLALGLMAYAAFSDGQPLLSGTHKMWTAVRTASICFAISQFYFSFSHLVNLHAMLNALSNYYDSDMNSVLRWMRLSIFFLPLVGLFIPLIVFIQSIWLAYLSLLILGGVFFLVDGFCSYVVSTVPASIVEAEEEGYDEEKDVEAGLMADQYKTDDSESQAAMSLDPENLQRVERAVQLWVSRGSYMKSGLKLPQVADEINVPRYLLTAWLRNQQLKYADWMTGLRINAAKQVLLDHPEWNNEAVAQHCGFSDRTYFQRKFKQITGRTPNDFILQ